MDSLEENIAKIDALKKEWDSLQPLKKEDEDRLWQKFRLEWDYNSNHIEGNTLTYGETMLLILKGKATGDHDMREFEEMKAHDVAIKVVREWANDKARELTETDIRSLNKLILVEPFWKEAITFDGQPTRRLIKIGEYKEHLNSVRLQNGEIFHYASPEETPRKMNELIAHYRKAKQRHSLITASDLHYNFVCIHPFDDGNGRVSRLLMNYELMRNAYPPVIIKSDDKRNYLFALQKADAGDMDSFYNYIAQNLIHSLQSAINHLTI